MPPTRLLVVDDHRMFLDGLTSILRAETDYEIALTAGCAREVLDYLAAGHEAQLVITDVNMDEMDGVALNRRLKKDYPDVKTLAVSMRHDAGTIHALTEGGVDGYVPKDAGQVELLKAIRAILRGERYFTESIQKAYMASLFGQRTTVTEVELTRREKEVLRLIAAEKTSQEIADELFLSKHTVEGYRKNLISKLGVRNLAGLVKEAVKRGLA